MIDRLSSLTYALRGGLLSIRTRLPHLWITERQLYRYPRQNQSRYQFRIRVSLWIPEHLPTLLALSYARLTYRGAVIGRWLSYAASRRTE